MNGSDRHLHGRDSVGRVHVGFEGVSKPREREEFIERPGGGSRSVCCSRQWLRSAGTTMILVLERLRAQ
jgi:hypothetical protein